MCNSHSVGSRIRCEIFICKYVYKIFVVYARDNVGVTILCVDYLYKIYHMRKIYILVMCQGNDIDLSLILSCGYTNRSSDRTDVFHFRAKLMRPLKISQRRDWT